MKKLFGHEAIEAKMNDNCVVLNKFADPIEGEILDLTVEEALDIADEDPSLIYCTAD